MNRPDLFLHNHKILEENYNIPKDKVMVDREDWQKVKRFLYYCPITLDRILEYSDEIKIKGHNF